MVDTAVEADELAQLKDSLQESISFIPADALVGLITYGKMCFVHELGFADCPRSYVFQGEAKLTPALIQEQLGINLSNDPLKKGDSPALRRFLAPVGECEYTLNSIIDDLQPDPWPRQQGHRAERCAGTALNISISILEATASAGRGSRIINFLGGAITTGPGKIVDTEIK